MKKYALSALILLSVLLCKVSGNASEKAGRVYVTNFGGKTVSVIDTKKNIKIADIHTGLKPHGVAISPDGDYVLVSNEGDNTVSVIDPSTNKVIKQIEVGRAPNQLAVTRNGEWIYVTNHKDGTVSVIDTNSFKVIDTVSVGEWPHIVYPSHDGNVMFVTCEKDQKIVIIDIATRKKVEEVFINGFPRVMDITRDGEIVYLSIRGFNGVLLVSHDKSKVVDMIELAHSDKFPSDGKYAHGLALTPDNKHLYITSQILNTVSVMNISTLKIEKEIPVGDNPNWIGFTPDGRFAYVSNTGSFDVSVIDVKKDKVIKSIAVGTKPKRLAVGKVIITQENKAESIKWNFDKETTGKLPAGWKVEATNLRGKLATWKVISDSKNNKKTKVLGMTKANDDSGSTFNICWTNNVKYKDAKIEVRFKAIKGVVDQGGGPIWRVQDKNNYYIARANPLESNFRVYYVKNGARRTLDSARVNIPSKKWHTIKIVHTGNHIKGYLNGKKYLDYKDSTFPDAGGVGLWTKADAVTYFDDYEVKFLK